MPGICRGVSVHTKNLENASIDESHYAGYKLSLPSFIIIIIIIINSY